MILLTTLSLLWRIRKTSLKQPFYTWALINDLLKRGSKIDVLIIIINVANDCNNYGLKNIIVSDLTINDRLHLDFINAMYNALKLDYVKYGYNFIDNSNIIHDNLWQQDGLHLNNSGKGKLLNNLLVFTNIDILLISETKLDGSFPSAQFWLKGFYTPYRFGLKSE